MPLIEALIAEAEEMAAWRHHIHAHPETAFEEHGTAEFVAAKLAEFGLEVHRGLAGTGVVGVLKRGDGPAVGLRADMDALHLDEQTGLAHASRHQGRMHACGHDGHTAMLLGAARHLARAGNVRGTVVFIFQPAEENEGGGRRMVEEGLFKRFPVDAVFGLHNWPGLPAGTFAVRAGPVMAATAALEIVVRGQGAHAAMPHMGSDAVLAAAQVVTALQSIAARNVPPVEAAVVSIGQIRGGDTWNVLPAEVLLRGTLRAFGDDVMALLEGRVLTVAQGVAAALGCGAEVTIRRGYPATANSAAESETAARAAAAVAGDDKVVRDHPPSMGAEDFAYMLAERPGCYAWLGNGPADDGRGLHSPRYDFNDAILPVGASYWVRLAETVLA